ncbi:MAG TPA: spore protease YyaC [Clostridia bacterium]|nr:spore protease YyaC [Clostridia bacterium]
MANKIFPLFSAPPQKIPTRVHMNEPLAIYHLSTHLQNFLKTTPKKKQPLILCIGTDRATGDSLGPLTGWQLQTLLRGTKAEVLGTIDSPVHAGNLQEIHTALSPQLSLHPLIAIDACLGRFSNVGTIVFQNKPLKPGTALKKSLPAVGDVGITGVVNIGGLMERQVIQNTRLSIVLKMSRIIAYSIFLALNEH